jgi:excisionase family DNA binding protein
MSDLKMSDLKMLTQDELGELLNVHRDSIVMLRETGVIQATKLGKCYMFSQEEIKRFQRDYKGYDVSNKVKALESYKKVNSMN